MQDIVENSNAKKILIIDDDILILKSIEKQLKNQNFNLCIVSNPVLAVKLAFEKEFDLILTDINMYPVNGFEILKKIRAYRPGIPVIVITGSCDENTKNTMKELGCSDFLVKPIRKKQLIDAITNVRQIY